MSVKSKYQDLEDILLRLIAQHLDINSNASKAEKNPIGWKIDAISKSSIVANEAKKSLSKVIKDVPLDLEEELKETSKKETGRTKTLLSTGKEIGGSNVALEEAMSELYNEAYNKLNLTNATMLKSVKKEYVKLINDAAEMLVKEEKTYQESVRECIKNLANKGLTGFYDKAGREWTPEAYVSMVVKGANKGVVNATTFYNMDKFGYDLAQVSSHAGSRPKCAPFQGKLVSKSGKSGTCIDGSGNKLEYIPLASTSYGQPDGLLGINCEHYLLPFMPGVSTITSKVQPQGENDRVYELSQKQRELERGVRKAKREENMLKKANDEEGAKSAAEKVKQKQKKLREFTTETGRTRRYDREKVYSAQERLKNALKGKSPYNGDLLNIDDRLIQKIGEAEKNLESILPNALSDIDIFKNATDGEVFSIEMWVDNVHGDYIVRKGFNFGTSSSDIKNLQEIIERSIRGGYYFKETTVESLIYHESAHSYLYTYALEKNGCHINATITEQQWKSTIADFISTNNFIVEQAQKKYPDIFDTLKEEIGSYPFESKDTNLRNQEIIAQCFSKFLSSDANSDVVNCIVDEMRGLKK